MRDLHQGRLLMHLAQTFSLLQGPTTPTTVHLMHQDPEVVALVTTLTVLRNLPQSQLEDASLVGSQGITLVIALPRILFQLIPMQPR